MRKSNQNPAVNATPKASVIRHSQLLILALSLMVAIVNTAEAKSCSDLASDLRAMQKAQESLLSTMVKKNESMASTMDQYASTLGSKKKIQTSDVTGMRKSATAYRNHQERETKLVKRFESKTDELLTLVEDCLKSKTIASE